LHILTKSSKLLAISGGLALALVAAFAIFVLGGGSPGGNGPKAASFASAAEPSATTHRFKTRPDLDPPKMTVLKSTPAASGGKLFVGSKVAGAGIYDAEGDPIWFRPGEIMDFRVQKYRGKKVLTWFQGPTKGSGLKRNTYIIANQNYKPIKKVYPGNGLSADSHEFNLTGSNTALVTAYDGTRADLRPLGGPRNGPVNESIAQEVDVRTGRVLWQWRSLDHVPIRDSYVSKPRHPGQAIDYFHINSVNRMKDGNILISGRGANAVYKVSRKTGRIIWQLGGKRSDFKMGKGARFHQQHDAQQVSGNRISVFDNTTSPTVKTKPRKQSRGLVLKLNFKKMTAKVDKQFRNPAKPLSNQQANVQKLKGGNFLVGWGGVPLISEYRPNGEMEFDAQMEGINSFYRAYREKWSGKAPGRVRVLAKGVAGGKTKLWISWNGDSKVRDWQVLAGGSKGSLKKAGQRAREGFETVTAIPSGAAYVRVKGLNGKGRAIGSSKPVKVR
jgi:Arylsulfotransferase (ASST)